MHRSPPPNPLSSSGTYLKPHSTTTSTTTSTYPAPLQIPTNPHPPSYFSFLAAWPPQSLPQPCQTPSLRQTLSVSNPGYRSLIHPLIPSTLPHKPTFCDQLNPMTTSFASRAWRQIFSPELSSALGISVEVVGTRLVKCAGAIFLGIAFIWALLFGARIILRKAEAEWRTLSLCDESGCKDLNAGKMDKGTERKGSEPDVKDACSVQ
ncbi:hypothetical protein K432DRAFT_421913 [Lepidopterella palustris CBS 459.81]|uniref:Uncharacterized protein n=1 Tax=Lepidopterella palustris CBS 459.81 TaxID=1314670 RepID=A0A8E2JK14_9PEZI|nr:hypothetical protein K432DRAFT_421913 [Lepidopterella palustris CBS 459.81]